MNKKIVLAASIAVVGWLGIGSIGTPFSMVPSAQAQHQNHDDHEEHEDERDNHEGQEKHEEGVVHLNTAQLSRLKLAHVEVKRGSLTSMVEVSGEVAWNADRLVHVTPRVSGIVYKVEKTLGDRVELGDILCVLNSREMGNAKMEYLVDLSQFEVAQADFNRAQIVYENTKKLLAILDPQPTPQQALTSAHNLPVGSYKNKLLTSYTRMKVNHRNFKRNEELLSNKIASEAEFHEAQGQYEISRADYMSTCEEISFDLERRFLRAKIDYRVAQTKMRNAERALHILGLTNEQTSEIALHGEEVDTNIARATLASPITGIIVDRHLTHGELVNTDTKLFTIADLSEVWIMGRAYERDIRFLKPGQKTTIRLDAFPGEVFEGEVDYVANQLDHDTRTVQIRVVLPNPDQRHRPGMFGTVVIHIDGANDSSKRMGMLVPTAALQRVKGGFVVFQAIEPGEYKLVSVQVLGKSRKFAEVTGELSDGDLVAVGDTFVLMSEIGKEEMGGGHSH